MPNPFAAGTRPWTRITEALRAASTTVRGRGELVVTDSGRLLVPDGVKADKDLSPVTTAAEVAATYLPILTPVSTYTWNTDGTIATQTVGGITTTYTWNTNGTLATETRNGVTRTYAYNGSGTLASVA